MSREIKFRVWHKNLKKWQTELCLYLDNSTLGDVSECFHNQENNEDYVIQQYTGLKDVNGKEIYEGDILEEFFLSDDIRHYIVEWSEDGWFLVMISSDWSLLDALDLEPEEQPRMSYFYQGMRVVGNVFENVELLK